MKKAVLFLFTFAITTMQSAWAYGPGPYGTQMPGRGWGPGSLHQPRRHFMPQRKQLNEDPKARLKEAVDKLRTYMGKSDAADNMKMAAFLETEITPFFDFAYMTRWAAGRRYAEMSGSDKAAMEGEIKKLFLSALTKGLGSDYGDSRMQITNARRTGKGEVQVGLRIVRHNGPPVKMKFRFYRNGDDWKVFDVIAFNSSAVMYFRKHFNKRSL